THHVHILEMNGDPYRLATSKKRQQRANLTDQTSSSGVSMT
ncbi:MAG: ATP-binding protein, partial [Gammaproteobacteria bacterium]|nr:ATP-binding protein [Gammaproteobacteria bacterium]